MNAPRLLYVFDMDNTILESSAKIKYTDIDGHLCELTTMEYNKLSEYIKSHPDEFNNLNFDDFKPENDDLNNAVGLPLYKVMCALYKAGQNIAILTSREEHNYIFNFFAKECEINLPKSHIICINQYKNLLYPNTISDAELKKQAILNLSKPNGYNFFVIYDDNEENVMQILSINDEYPDLHVFATSNFLAYSV